LSQVAKGRDRITESELVEAIASFYDLVLGAMALYISVCSGYLVVAYLIGSNLTKLQTFIISALYIFVASTVTYSVFGWFNRAHGYLEALKSIGDTALGGASGSPMVGDILTVIMVAGILACLKFMWDVRHSKTD
jgi:hypothetical protein